MTFPKYDRVFLSPADYVRLLGKYVEGDKPIKSADGVTFLSSNLVPEGEGWAFLGKEAVGVLILDHGDVH